MEKTMIDLRGRSFLTLKDFSEEEIQYLIKLASELKDMKKTGKPHRYLEGQNIALLFEKPSVRTRIASTVACVDLGAHPEYIGENDFQFGKKESVRDTVKVIGSVFDGIQYSGFEQKTVDKLAQNTDVPVWNGWTDEHHPTQILADFLTIKENIGHLKGVRLVYIGDGRSNVATSLLIGAAKVGMDIRICSPAEFLPDQDLVTYAEKLAETSSAKIMATTEVVKAVEGADAIYTDVWVTEEEEEHFGERIHLLKPYQVNEKMLELTGNKNVLFLHCLPALHDLETEVGQWVFEKFGLKEMEVTDGVFQSENSVVFEQSENLLHAVKAIMAATNQNNIN
jgi:ornithine carbamoyltransferase